MQRLLTSLSRVTMAGGTSCHHLGDDDDDDQDYDGDDDDDEAGKCDMIVVICYDIRC